MARISTYAPDVNITINDKILGSSYEGKQGGNLVFKTANFKVADLISFIGKNVNVTADGLSYSLVEINGNIGSLTDQIAEINLGLSNLREDLLDQTDNIDTLEQQTGLQLTLLDENLSEAIQGVADTLTDEVGDLNQKILDGDTNLSQDLINLTGTVNQQASDLTDLINTSIQTTTENLTGEISVVQQAVNDLDTNIGLELGQINLDIAGALQSAIDAGDLATAAQASIDSEIIARADADGAIAGRVDTLDTQFEFSTEDGSIVGASGALNQTINTAASTAAGAVATRVDILETEYTIDTEAGTITGFSENSVTNLALTTVTGAVALRVDEIETQFAITDGEITGFSEAAQTRVDQSISDATQAQFLTLDAVKAQFVFSDGNITNVADVLDTSIENRISTATSAQFQKIDEVATQFIFDANGNVDGVQGSISSTIDSSKQEAISAAGIAAQSKVDTFAAKIVTTDANGNVTGLSDAVQTSVSDVVAGDGYASSGELNTLSSSVGLIPRIYRQNDAPSLTETPIGSLWFDTNNNNKSYVLVAGSPNVWTTVQDLEFTAFKATAIENIQTNADNNGANATKITNLNATLDILNEDGTVKKTSADFLSDIRTDVDANSATASKAESLRVDIEGQDGTGGLSASVSTAQEAIGTINGKLTASYGVHVNAGGKIAGLKLLADSTTTSSFIAQADEFGVDMPNGTRVLTVDSGGLLINGSGTFTGDFNAGLVEIRSNTIKLKATPTYGSTGDIEFYNQAGNLFGTIQSRSVNIDGTDHDAITVGSPFGGALDTVVIDAQSIIANPADYTNFPTSTGGVQFGNFVTPWEKFSAHATGSIGIRTGAAGELFDINSVFLNDGTGPFVSITSRGYVSINATSDINLNPGSGFNVLINGSPIGSTGGTSHPDITAAASVNNSNGTVIQDVTLDSNGHVTGLASINLDNRYLRTSVSGTVSGTITATDFILSSDQRLKSDINTYVPQPINIKYRDYLINNGGDRRRVGVIAQELEKDHPEFVMTNPDTGMKAVSYIDMLVAKVAELEERIKQLENGGA
jgi:hypothetical protein